MSNDKKNNLFSWINFFKKNKIKKNKSNLNKDNDKDLKLDIINTIQKNNNNNLNLIDTKKTDKLSNISYSNHSNKEKIFNNIKCSISNFISNFKFKIKKVFYSGEINDVFFEQLRETLLQFDFGYSITNSIVDHLINQYRNNTLNSEEEVYLELKRKLLSIININSDSHDILLQNNFNYPYIILIIGVNGVGKTTTVAKLAYLYKKLGKSVLLSASDTFRAAAIEQLEIWGTRLSIPVFKKNTGSDPSSVIFDSIEFAISKKVDVLIIDTAGRLHNKINLMEELKKNIRVIKKKILRDPHEVLLVLDSCSGQNAIIQTELFYKQLNQINGLILTKLDGTAKGGIIFSIVKKFSIPIKYIGIGEQLKDLNVFNSKKFIDNMF